MRRQARFDYPAAPSREQVWRSEKLCPLSAPIPTQSAVNLRPGRSPQIQSRFRSKRNSFIMYAQIFDPVAHSLSWSALFAALPLFTLFISLGVFRWEARWAALTSLAVSIAVATGIYAMRLGQSMAGAAEGAAVGFFPII